MNSTTHTTLFKAAYRAHEMARALAIFAAVLFMHVMVIKYVFMSQDPMHHREELVRSWQCRSSKV